MLELAPRNDLKSLKDSELAERFDVAIQAHESLKKRYGFTYFWYALSWLPRAAVSDPREYLYPSHVLSEIRDIETEMMRRVAHQKETIS